jgi:hypothetical protein
MRGWVLMRADCKTHVVALPEGLRAAGSAAGCDEREL